MFLAVRMARIGQGHLRSPSKSFQQMPIAVAELVKTPGGAKPSGAATKYENLHE